MNQGDVMTYLSIHLTKLQCLPNKINFNLQFTILGVDEDITREHEEIDMMMSKLEFLIFHKDHMADKPLSDPGGKFHDWRTKKKKGILYR